MVRDNVILHRLIRSTEPTNGVITINDDCNFVDNININFQELPIVFTGKVKFIKDLKIEGRTNVTFNDAEIQRLDVNNNCILSFSKCKIEKIYHQVDSNYYDSNVNYGKLNFNECNIDSIDLNNFFGKVRIENNKVNTINIGGRNVIDVEICGKKSKNSIKQFKIYGEYGLNDCKGQIYISNCIIGEEANLNAFAAKGLNINLTDVDFMSDVELTEPFNTFDCNESIQFKKLNVRNISKKISESNSEALLKGFIVKELCFLESYDKIILDQLNIGNLKLYEAKDLKTLTIKGCTISDFIISSNVLKSLEIFGSEIKTKIELLKIEEFVEIYCDSKGQQIEIIDLEFTNCTIPKDKHLKFYSTKIQKLKFQGVLNYGNVIFTDVNTKKDGLFKIENSDLGKMIFMKCDFSTYKMHFVSSKIIEIFLAGTTMPKPSDINNELDFKDIHIGNRRLALTQLKKVFENRGDLFGATKYHKAELDNWLYEIPKTNLNNIKIIFGLYKKMYEVRGDTVKAIEYFGKELDVQREILEKQNGISCNKFWERLQLMVNKYSNNFGQSWQWALGWIFGLGILIYIIYCRSLGFTVGSGKPNEIETFKSLFSYFFEFINPIRKGEFIQMPLLINGKIENEYVTITPIARVIDFVWRIIITYLGYQLIQAFRKYSKKTS